MHFSTVGIDQHQLLDQPTINTMNVPTISTKSEALPRRGTGLQLSFPQPREIEEDFEVEDSWDTTHQPLQFRDSGTVACRILTAAILFGSLILGLPLAYGVFQDHYAEAFPGNKISPWIGVLSAGLQFLGAPTITYCCQHYSLDARYYIIIGWGFSVVSLLASVFCKSLDVLVVTQGLLYGVGCLLVNIPALTLINIWFEKRRGLAYGLIFGGADLLSIAYTFLIAYLLSTYGFKITMAVLVAIVFSLAGPPLLLLQGCVQEPTRQPISSISAPSTPSPPIQHHRQVDMHPRKYYKCAVFYVFTLANLLQALAFYLPFIYLPSFTTEIGHPTSYSALVLSIANLAQVFGEVGFGKLSDKIHVKYLVIVSTTLAAISVFVLWGLFAARSLPALLVFAFVFGCFGSGFLALWARMGTLFGEKDAQTVFSTLCLGRGIGSIVSGPISSALLSTSNTTINKSMFGAGSYAGIVLFVGACMAGSAIVGVCGILILSWKDKPLHREKVLENEAA